MRTNKISFGQTYIKPTVISNLTEHNQQKVMSLIPLGELYPTDIYLGANKEGNLIVEMLHSTMGKFMYFSGEVPKTPLNTSILQFMDSMEKIARKGLNLPVYRLEIKELDKFNRAELQYTVHEKLVHYYKNMIDKKFFN